MKPHIKILHGVYDYARWQCEGNGCRVTGVTPLVAYLNWIREIDRRDTRWQYVPTIAQFEKWDALQKELDGERGGFSRWLLDRINKKPR